MTTPTTVPSRWVVPFAAGDRSQRDLLGGKGANLAEMTRLGLPVPGGFVVTTEACREYLRTGAVPAALWDQLQGALIDLEAACGRRLGDPARPLLLSVRSGAPFSMPGMMDTVLNLGLNDVTVEGLATATGDRRFAFDAYRRLLQLYGKVVLGVDGALFEQALARHVTDAGVADEAALSPAHLVALVETFAATIRREAGAAFPQDPGEQLHRAVEAVFRSWNGRRARDYRRMEGIPDELGTAANVQQMVFGNLGGRSGTGVAFTRDPATGARRPYGDWLPGAQARTSWPASATPVRWTSWRRCSRRAPRSWPRCSPPSRRTTKTCAASSSPSSRSSCSSSRPGSASAPRPPRWRWPPTWWPRA